MSTHNSHITALIVDDEKGARETLTNLLKSFCPEVELLGTASSVKNAIKLTWELKPDMIFLDVEMPEESGFELIEQSASIDSGVVFTTAHSQYALKAIKASALDYLLKPIDITDLKAAIKKYKDTKLKFDQSQFQLLKEQIAYRAMSKNEISRLAIASNDGYDIIDINEIQYCEGNRNYTSLYVNGSEVFTASKTLKEYEKLLPSSDFIRVHQKYLINLKFVKKIHRGRGGSLVMADGKIIAVSQNKKTALLETILK